MSIVYNFILSINRRQHPQIKRMQKNRQFFTIIFCGFHVIFSVHFKCIFSTRQGICLVLPKCSCPYAIVCMDRRARLWPISGLFKQAFDRLWYYTERWPARMFRSYCIAINQFPSNMTSRQPRLNEFQLGLTSKALLDGEFGGKKSTWK